MGKALPIVAIVCAGMAFLESQVFIDAATMLPPLAAIVGGVFLALQKRWEGYATGGAVVVASILAILGVMDSIKIKGNAAIDFGVGPELGLWLALTAGMGVAAATVWLRMDHLDAPWPAFVTWGAAGLGSLAALIWRSSLENHFAATSLVVAVFVLVTLVGPIMLLVGGAAPPARPARLTATPPSSRPLGAPRTAAPGPASPGAPRRP